MNAELIKASGFTQGEVAEMIDVSRVMINRYLSKKSVPTIKPIIHRIAKFEAIISKELAEHRLPLDVDKVERAAAISGIKQQLL